jgi:glucose-6-phosphate 1-dehydrogenase
MTLLPPPPQDLIIVGPTGDLAQRKLLPALYNLHLDGLLPPEGEILGYARREMEQHDFHALAAEAIRRHSRRPFDDDAWRGFCSRLSYISGREHGVGELANRTTQARRLIYLATPPSAFEAMIGELATHDLVTGTSLIVEKPFGHDLDSGRDLDATLHRHFDEEQVFRIDHYLGKETVQNILVFRFGNALFERVWHRDAIDNVQITVAESDGLGGRAGFYEEVGAIRDIIQNHVLQVLALLTMEPPASFDADAIQDEKNKVLRSITPVDPKHIVLGQYGPGEVDGDPVAGYREEDGVDGKSRTETFAALRLKIDNWRWSGVPFYLRSGKRLPRRVTEVHVQFRDAPITLFEGALQDADVERLNPNHITLRIQPAEAITLSFLAKVPGPEIQLSPVRMNFSYDDHFKAQPPEAYERLLLDAMEGDRTLFLRGDTVDRSWEIVQPVLDAMPAVYTYPAGSWGPAEADELVAPREWHLH